MKIFNLSMECYPVAKVGGLADVVGALPKYLNKIDGVEAIVDLESRTARINLTKEVTDDVIKNAVDDVGYEVTQITAFSEK